MDVSAFLYAAILGATPLLLATVGEIITEKSGSLNLGVEGMMYMGAISAFLTAASTGSIVLAVLAGALGGALGALIFAFLTVTLKGNQNVTGLTLTIFGTGLAGALGTLSLQNGMAISDRVIAAVQPLDLGFLSKIPVIGPLLFSHRFFVYLALLLAILFGLYLNRTRFGRNVRSIGENPSAADAAGVNVNRYKYVHILIGGLLAGLGGAYVSLVTCGRMWVPGCIAGQGWIAVALVIFSSWKPYLAVLGSIVFGGLQVLRLYITLPQAMSATNPALYKSLSKLLPPLFSLLPYLATCVVLVISSIRMKPENQQPKACGVNYFREER